MHLDIKSIGEIDLLPAFGTQTESLPTETDYKMPEVSEVAKKKSTKKNKKRLQKVVDKVKKKEEKMSLTDRLEAND